MVSTAPALILIHGRGVKAGPDQEFARWKAALETNLGGDPAFATANLRMAYYSDDLYPELRLQPQGVSEAEVDKHLVQGQVLAELLARYREYEAELARERVAVLAATNTLVPQAVHPLPPVRLAAGELYDPFVLDVIKYFSLGYREPITARLEEALVEAGDAPILLISHSLGTVVAYDVLTTKDLHVDTWITLGCPLGFVEDIQAQLPGWMNELPPDTWAAIGQAATSVQATVTAAKERIESFVGDLRHRLHLEALLTPQKLHRLSPKQFPIGKVERWYNIFDPLDPVTNPPAVGDPTIADEFLANGQERVYDIQVRNPRRPETHSEVGYLEALQTVWVVKDFLLRHTRNQGVL
jgi:hypothetical protein